MAKADPARPLRNDGREQLVPLMVLEVATEDLHAVGLGLTSRALGRALLPGGHSTVAEALEDMAAGHLDSSLIGDRPTPADLVAEAARLHGLLDLPPDDHVARLTAALPGGGGDVVLSPQLEEDYELLVDRFLAIWHVGDRLAAYLYRGLR